MGFHKHQGMQMELIVRFVLETLVTKHHPVLISYLEIASDQMVRRMDQVAHNLQIGLNNIIMRGLL